MMQQRHIRRSTAAKTISEQPRAFKPRGPQRENSETFPAVAVRQSFPESRAAAKTAGVRFYFTGRPCLRGHIALRRTSKGSCIVCQYAWTIRWRADNPELSREAVQRWRDTNREKYRALSRESRRREYHRDPVREREKTRRWREENREQWLRTLSVAGRKWRQNNPAKELHRVRMRQVAKLNATPPWADLAAIKATYLACPAGWDVDHIIPLRGRTPEGWRVCGLHIASNLRHLPSSENRVRGNRMTADDLELLRLPYEMQRAERV